MGAGDAGNPGGGATVQFSRWKDTSLNTVNTQDLTTLTSLLTTEQRQRQQMLQQQTRTPQGVTTATTPVVPAYHPNVSRMRSLKSGLATHIPKKAGEPLSSYTYFNRKILGTFPAQQRGYYRAGEVEDRMQQHVDRFLASSEITDEDVVRVAETCLDSSGLLDLFGEDKIVIKSSNPDEVTLEKAKLTLIQRIREIDDKDLTPEAIEKMLNDYKLVLGEVEGERFLPYLKKYPYAAKAFILQRSL